MTGFGPESKVGKVIFAMIFIPFSLASKAKDALSKLRTKKQIATAANRDGDPGDEVDR
jgi:hypothetical protein